MEALTSPLHIGLQWHQSSEALRARLAGLSSAKPGPVEPAAMEDQEVNVAKDWTPEAAAAAVRLLYKHILEREVDDSGLINWAGALDRGQMSVRDVVRAIGKSREYKDRFVIPFAPSKAMEKMYEHFLARHPENSKVVTDWAETLVTKGFDVVVDGFVDSQEYTNRFGDDSVPL